VFRTPKSAGDALNRPVVAIGNFDGVHRGHQAVVRTAIERADALGVDTAVLTFEPHPVRFFRPEMPAFRLTTLEQKAERLEALGVDGVVPLDFDEEISNLSPEEFVENILHDGLRASAVLVGSDFRFGKGRAGDTAMLRELCAARDIEVIVIEQVLDDGDAISSSRIRQALAEGDLEMVTALLGRHYAIRGNVVSGEKNGRKFGFPTANIDPDNPLLPPDGIYASWLTDPEHGRLPAATYVGTRPTLDGEHRAVEAFCLDVEEPFDIYGHHVDLEFVESVRGDQKFESVDAMIEQMHRDVANVRGVLAQN
jgi:riboflavin kinase/FMN adenylyltransferase